MSLPLCPRLKLLTLISARSSSFHENGVRMELPESFVVSLGNLMHLQMLRMLRFSRVPESVGSLTQLQELYLEDTTELPDSLIKLFGLKVLKVDFSYSNRL